MSEDVKLIVYFVGEVVHTRAAIEIFDLPKGQSPLR